MYHEEFKSLLSKLRPVIRELADAFWLTTLLDPDQQKDVHAVAQAMAAELLDESYTGKHILLEPPPAQSAKGKYPLGTVIYANRPMGVFGLRENDLPQHLLILGRSGAGKTNVGYWLVWNLLRAGKPFIVLDWRKNYRHFLNRPEGKDILLFTLGEDESLSFNPLNPPPNLSQSQREAYIRDVVSVICTTYLPGYHLLSTRGVEYFFLKSLELLNNDNVKPLTFNDIRLYMEGYKTRSREMDWKVSAENILFKLTTGPIGRLMNSTDVSTINNILNDPVIMELDSLGSETDRSMFTQTFMLWLYYYRLAEGKSRTFKHALIIEEAHNIFLQSSDSRQSVHDVMIRQMRDLSQALILLDQNPSLLSIPSLGNTSVTICLNLKHGEDVKAAGKALTLPPEDWNNIGRLMVGNAIVKVSDRWQKPFLVHFPYFPVSKEEKPPETIKRYSVSDSLQRKADELRSALNEAIRALPESDRREKKEDGISEQERSLLLDIAKHSLSVVTERYKRLGWSAHTGTEIKWGLLEKGFIEQERVGVTKGSVTLLKLTTEGRDLLTSCGIEVKVLPKNASLEHEYYKEFTAEKYRKMGYEVKEEVQIGGGKAIDLVATKGDERFAIEVETGKSNEKENVNKCKGAGFEKVVVVRTDRSDG